MMKRIFTLTCLSMILLSACNSPKNMVKLSDTKWILQEMNGQKLQIQDADKALFIQFNEVEKRVSGLAGCNRFFGGYEMDAKKLKFSPMGATRMACPDMNIESEFFKMLESTGEYTLKNHQLSLLHDGNVIALFKGEAEVK